LIGRFCYLLSSICKMKNFKVAALRSSGVGERSSGSSDRPARQPPKVNKYAAITSATTELLNDDRTREGNNSVQLRWPPLLYPVASCFDSLGRVAHSLCNRAANDEEALAKNDTGRVSRHGYIWKLNNDALGQSLQEQSKLRNWRRRHFYVVQYAFESVLVYCSEKEDGNVQLACTFHSANVTQSGEIKVSAISQNTQKWAESSLALYDISVMNKTDLVDDKHYASQVPEKFFLMRIDWKDNNGGQHSIMLGVPHADTRDQWQKVFDQEISEIG